MEDKINIGLDLDETLIVTIYTNGLLWDLIENVDIYLIKLYEKFNLHIITSRIDIDSTNQIINKIEKKLNIKFESVNGVEMCEKKINVMKKLNCKFFVDDKYFNVKDCYTKRLMVYYIINIVINFLM